MPGASPADGGVDCALTGFDSIVIDLGDEADRLSTLVEESIATTVNGGPGNDELFSRAAAHDRLDGGPGDDTLHAWTGGGADEYVGGSGSDVVFFSSRSAAQSISLDGVANDGFAGEQDNVGTDVEVVHAGDGNDTLTGSGGNDHLHGGRGSDTVDGGGGDDVLDGGFSCADHDQVLGGAGDDTLHFGKGAAVDGGADDDLLRPESINCPPLGSTVRGGAGVDTADLRDLYQVTVSLDDVANDGDDDADDYRSDIENLTAGDSDMVLIGSAGPNVLTGGEGSDVLDGGGGADTLDRRRGLRPRRLLRAHRARQPDARRRGERRRGGRAGLARRRGPPRRRRRRHAGRRRRGQLPRRRPRRRRDARRRRVRCGRLLVTHGRRHRRPRRRGSATTARRAKRDTVGADVEGAIGGAGDDRITGNGGDGVLVGAEGDDRIVDAGGEDIIDGGDGADELFASDGAADFVECGLGEDEVEFDEFDELSEECELPPEPDADAGTDRDPSPTPTPPTVPRPGARRSAPTRATTVAPHRDGCARPPRPRPDDARARRPDRDRVQRVLPRVRRAEGDARPPPARSSAAGSRRRGVMARGTFRLGARTARCC